MLKFNPFTGNLDFVGSPSSLSSPILYGSTDPVSSSDGIPFFNTASYDLKIWYNGVWNTLGTAVPPLTAPIIATMDGKTSPCSSYDSTPSIYITGVVNGDLVKVYDGATEIANGTATGITITLVSSDLPV